MPADETQLAVPRATELLRHAAMRCGGCGAKVGASTLSNAMKRLDSYIPRQPKSDKAHVALGAGDDAAVVDLAGVQTVQTIEPRMLRVSFSIVYMYIILSFANI